MERLFFELIQVAIGSRQSLSRVPTEVEWGELFAIAIKQALIGICFVGVQKLSYIPHPYTINLSEALRLRWLGMAVKIQQRNKMVTEACVEICKQYEHDGFDCCILKGQGNMVNYPVELREARTPGDIDIWMIPKGEIAIAVSCDGSRCTRYEYYTGERAVIEYVRQLWRVVDAKEIPLLRSHHIDAPRVSDVDVEAHFKPAIMCSPITNRRLQRWFQTFLSHTPIKGECGFPMPTNSFNVVYQLVHIYRHLFTEGIGLRQLLDYYFVLGALHIEQGSFVDFTQSICPWAEKKDIGVSSNIEIMYTIGRLGMIRFAGAVMYVLQQVFAMPDVYLLCEPDERAGRFLLDEIMMSGNFGQYDDRNAEMKGASKLKRFGLLTMRNLRFIKEYPSEVLWDPYRRATSWLWCHWY